MFGTEKYKNIDCMESASKSRSFGIAHFFKHISIAIWLKSLEYQFRGRDIYPFLEKSTWNQPIPQSLMAWWYTLILHWEKQNGLNISICSEW